MHPETFAKPSNPLSSSSRAILSTFAKHEFFNGEDPEFPDETNNKIRFMENDNTAIYHLEQYLPSITGLSGPVFVIPPLLKEAVMEKWVDNNRKINLDDPLLELLNASLNYHALKGVDSSFIDRRLPRRG